MTSSRAGFYVHEQSNGDVWASITHIAGILGMRRDSLARLKKEHAKTFPRAKEYYDDGRGRYWSVREVTKWYREKPETRGGINHRDGSERGRKAWRTRRPYG